jgi:hypothetical protein
MIYLLSLQRSVFDLAQKAEKRYGMLLAALAAHKRAGLGIASPHDAVGVLDELAAVALDLFYCHSCPKLSCVYNLRGKICL